VSLSRTTRLWPCLLCCRYASVQSVNYTIIAAGDVQAALHNVGDRLSASIRPVRDAPLFNFGIGASFELDRAAMQPIVSCMPIAMHVLPA